MDDDLMPNDGPSGFFFGKEPEDQVVARKREKAQTLQALPELKAMVARIQERIDYYERNSSIPDEVRLNPAEFLIMHNTYTLVAESLRSEKEYLEGLIEANAPGR